MRVLGTYHKCFSIITIIIISIFINPSVIADSQDYWSSYSDTYVYKGTYSYYLEYFDPINIINDKQHDIVPVELLNVSINQNVVNFRSKCIVLYFMGLQSFNTSEQYETYKQEVWDYDNVTQTGKAAIVYLENENKVCLTDAQYSPITTSITIPVDAIELFDTWIYSYLYSSWFLPIGSPNFSFVTDYSKYNYVNTSIDDQLSYTQSVSVKIQNQFWLNSTLYKGLKISTIEEEQFTRNGTVIWNKYNERLICYLENGILYNYYTDYEYNDYNGQKSITKAKFNLFLDEPFLQEGIISSWSLILLIVGTTTIVCSVIALLVWKIIKMRKLANI